MINFHDEQYSLIFRMGYNPLTFDNLDNKDFKCAIDWITCDQSGSIKLIIRQGSDDILLIVYAPLFCLTLYAKYYGYMIRVFVSLGVSMGKFRIGLPQYKPQS